MTRHTRSAIVHPSISTHRLTERRLAFGLAFLGLVGCGGQPDTTGSEQGDPDQKSSTSEPEASSAVTLGDEQVKSGDDTWADDKVDEMPQGGDDQSGAESTDHERTDVQPDTELEGTDELDGKQDSAEDKPGVEESDGACSVANLQTVSPANAGYSDTLYLRSDEDVWNLAALGCTVLPGTLFVSGAQVTSLAGLEHLSRVAGSLVLEALADLEDLSGLDGLKRIDGDLAIRSSEGLQSLTGLEQLEFLGGTLELETTDIRSLAALEDVQFGKGDLLLNSNGFESLQGLESLTYRENVVISGSRNLETLSGLNNLAHVAGDLTVTVNKKLTSLVGLNGLRTVGGALAVEWNDSLVTLDGLGALTQVEAGSIASNQLLTSTAALSGVTAIGDLAITDNASLSQVVLPAVRDVGGELSIEMNGSSSSEPMVLSCPVLETAGVPNDYETGLSVALNSNLSVIEMPVLNWAMAIDVHENEGTFSAEFPALQGAEMVAFWKNPGLWTIHSLPALTELGDSINIHTNDNLPSCELDEILYRLGECPECQSNPCNPH